MRYGQNYHIASLGISGRLAGGKVGKIVISTGCPKRIRLGFA